MNRYFFLVSSEFRLVHGHGLYSIKGLSTGGVHTRIQTRQFQAKEKKRKKSKTTETLVSASCPLISQRTTHPECGI